MQVREINLPIQYVIELPSQRSVIVTDVVETIKAATRNGHKIISAAQTIENEIEQVVAHYFFPEDKDKAKLFRGMILSTDWCTFRAKKRLLLQIINEHAYLNGKEKDNLERDLGTATRYRNAFTHGIVTGDDTYLVLQYYEAGPKEKKLDDALWEEMELLFLRLFKTMENVSLSTGLVKSVNYHAPAGPDS